MKKIDLPKPKLKGNMSLEEVIAKRRSIRSFDKRELTLEAISQLLWAAQGPTDSKRDLRTAPSAGALYPLEMYVATKDGLFHYLIENGQLNSISGKDIRADIAGAAWGQNCIKEAPAVFIIAAIYERVTLKYGERGVMYTHIEVGHAAENLLLQAVSLGLGSVPIGAFDEVKVKTVLGIPKNEEVLYIIPVGYPK